ncbi:xaa-Pro aminopeptidase 3-like [Hyposmocoma kahamanoa]|uniref:xaa-Pro aminopeptidase 3-like n=1 Tax=Hyposmocoma kahamanoa TaxID=1477025 RepID=UPI000E6D5DFC|nr:xaa-Pro aminopeptidase 3-like [Hyposmocoma kahamanoa]
MHSLKRLSWTIGKVRSKNVVKSTFESQLRCISKMETPQGQKEQPRISLSIPTGEMGQPTCHTHPHLIPAGQLTCGVSQAEYVNRRDFFVRKLQMEMENEHLNHVIVIPAAAKQYMTEKIPYTFRQNSDFYYLTGCMEPGAVLVIIKPAQTDNYQTILFVHDKNSHDEMWEGPRTGCNAAAKLFAVHEARPIESFSKYLSRTVSTKPCVLWYNRETASNPEIVTIVCKTLEQNTMRWGDPQRVLHFMRVIKSPAEIELMKETCCIGAQSINMAMACTKPGVSEHSINAVLDFTSRQGGAEHLAFPPVVAGGHRATHIHYVANNQLLHDNEMLLVDTGCQRWLYNSDLSRTWPVNGKFNPYHKILYEIVLTAQKRLIQLLGEQRQPLDQLFDQMCRLLGTYLQQERILPHNIDGNELIASAYRLCPHHVSHYLGLDVHDSPLVRRNVAVQTNMIVTVEPGLYIRNDDHSVPAEFRGVGIRVEDDVLITDSDPIVLTADAVKEIDDIEAIVGKHKEYTLRE